MFTAHYQARLPLSASLCTHTSEEARTDEEQRTDEDQVVGIGVVIVASSLIAPVPMAEALGHITEFGVRTAMAETLAFSGSAAGGNGQTFTIGIDGCGETQLTRDASNDLSPRYSPNAKRIASTATARERSRFT